MSKKVTEVLFLLFFLAITVTIVERSMIYSLKTYLFPLLVAIPVVGLIVAQIAREFVSRKVPSEGPEKTSQGSGLFAGLSLVWIILLIYLLGFMVGVPVGVFIYILSSREKWYMALALALAMLIVLIVLHLFGLYLYEGILLS
jgi:hypothetical protein